MTIYKTITIIELLRRLLLAILIPILVFYIFLVAPDYLACKDSMYEGENGTDVWGASVDCSGESRAFSVGFFQLFSIAVAVLTFVWSIMYIISNQLKKQL